MTEHRGFVRRVRLSTTPRPLWPWGWLLILGLLLVFVLALTVGAQLWIEDRVERAVSDRLRLEKEDWAKVSVSGQDVILRGYPPDAEAEKRALAIAHATLGSTWAGRQDATRRVIPDFSRGPPPSEAAEPLLAATAGDFRFRRHDDRILLTGAVPSEETIASLDLKGKVYAGQGRPPLAGVENRLVVDSRVRSETSSAAERALRVLGACYQGLVEAKDEVFSVRCALPEAQVASLRALAERPLPGYQVGSVEVLAIEEVDACEKRLADVLTRNVVEFATGSAVIEPEGLRVVDRVSVAAKDCPGTLKVEGHTDDVGQPDDNVNLSQARARSVLDALVERGLVPDRLDFVGFGETRPVADNQTEAGRQRNRRIEIHVVTN